MTNERFRAVWWIDGGAEVTGNWFDFEHEAKNELDSEAQTNQPYATFEGRIERGFVGIANDPNV